MNSQYSPLGHEGQFGYQDYVNELQNMTEIPVDGPKYSSGSSVYANQSIVNPNSQELTYCIASILQSEIFDHLEYAGLHGDQSAGLDILTSLPPHLGGPTDCIETHIIESETVGDPELRNQLMLGTVPTVDTILRFICWIYQSAKYSAQCNILAFVYIKRITASHRVLRMNNWRGLWLGAVIIAQKFSDDKCLRTGSFASILPGVSKEQLKAAELQVFHLLEYTGLVKPSIFAKFYFELRCIFLAITGQSACCSKAPDGRTLPPLRRAQALWLYEAPDERPESSPRIRTPVNPSLKAPARVLPPLVLSRARAADAVHHGATAPRHEKRAHDSTAREHKSKSENSPGDSSRAELESAPTKLPPVRLHNAHKKSPGQTRTSLKYAAHRPDRVPHRAATTEDLSGVISKAIFVVN